MPETMFSSTASRAVPRVLIFDDNPAIAAQIEHDMKEAGFFVCSTARISEILKLAEEFRPDVSIFDIKIDIEAQGPRDGIVAFQKLRKLNPFVEGIFVTAFADVSEYVARARSCGADIIPKPYESKELAQSVSERFKISRERRLDEWLRLAVQAEEKGVDPNQVLDLISDIVANYSTRYRGKDMKMVDADGVSAALAITDLVARNRELVPSLIDLFGSEVEDLTHLLRAESLGATWKKAAEYAADSLDVINELKREEGYGIEE